MTYNPEHVEFKTTDHLLLPGLLFRPEKQTKKVALYLHGNGSASVFYSPRKMNILARSFNKKNIAFFPFNNRGAHYIKSLDKLTDGPDERVKLGTTYELIKDCIYDIDGALKFLSEKWFNEFYLIGISTGANKIVVYDKYRKNNPVSKYILLSGGDDTGLYYQQMGRKLFFESLKRAQKEVEHGNGRRLVPKYIVDYLFSWQALYDTINPEGDYNIFPFNDYMNKLRLSKKPLFKEFSSMTKPSLVIYGEKDEYCYGDVPRCVEILKQNSRNKRNFIYKIIKEADHSFHGKEEELADIISGWI